MVIMAGSLPLRPLGSEAQDDDSSGRGRGRGRGHGGNGHGDRDAEAGPEITELVPEGAIEVRIVSDDAGGFIPGELIVDAGQVIAFINSHSDEHTATGSGFDTGIIASGSIATVTLDSAGVYYYACLIHPEMTGVIRVRDGSGNVPDTAPEVLATSRDGPTIAIENLSFSPAVTRVAPGTTVTWRNADSVPHTVTSTTGEFDSGIFDPGSSFQFTFQEPGVFDFVCQLHPRMRGAIEVGGPLEASQPLDAEGAPDAQGAAPGATPTAAGPNILPGPWMMELLSGGTGESAEYLALMTFHQDGTLAADFVGREETAGSSGRLGPGHGEWEQQGNRISVAVAVLVLDEDGSFGGLLFVEGDLAFETDGSTLTGDVTLSGPTLAGEPTSRGGSLRGLLIPIGTGSDK